MHPLLNVAVMAAHRGGDTLIRSLNQLDRIKVEIKGRNDFVSEVDRAAERAVIDLIHKHYPDHAILAEESGAHGDSEFQWVIDPLDGTTNYLHGFPIFAVSVALLHRGQMEHAAVHDPMRQETFTASRGRGAQLNGHRLRVSGCTSLERSLIGTGFPFRNAERSLEPYFGMLKKAIAGTAGVRRPGAAAIDLCYVAAGRLDAFWEIGLSKWDLAGGALVIREAGGIVTGLDGGEDFLETGHVLAATPKIHTAVARLFAPEIAQLFAER